VLGTAAAAYLAGHSAPAAAAGAAAAGAAGAAHAAGAGAAGTAGAAAGEAAAGGGASALGSVTAWVAGTHAGQAAAAAVAAVVIGGTTVVATHGGGPSHPTPAIAATSTATDRADRTEPATATTRAASPTASPSPGATPTTTAGPTATGTGTAPTASATGSGAPTRTGAAPTTPALPPPPRTGPVSLIVGAPHAQGTLKVGTPGDVAITVRNPGDDDAENVVATVRLPPGLSAAPGSGSNGWDCAGSAGVATCTRDELDAGDDTTLHVHVAVAVRALPGALVSGTVRAGGTEKPIPGTLLMVLP
jgi:uncharacterized repeat protein (TIGR01451 family)